MTLLAAWAFFRSMRGMDVPSAARTWGRAAAVGGLAVLVLSFYPLSWRESGIPGGIFTALTGMILLFVTVWALATAAFPRLEFPYQDVFDDLAAVFQGWKKSLGRFAAPLVWLEKLAAFPPLANALAWFRPRRHRWHLVLAAAALPGLFLLLPEVIVEGASPNLRTFLLVVGVYVGIAGAAVLLGYVLLGEYLGIY